MPDKQSKIADLAHPEYSRDAFLWNKWRRTFEGGDRFIDFYLKKFSSREENPEFKDRKEISYVPAFSKAAVNDVKDAIFQRIADVSRSGGSESYQNSVLGLDGGVDLAGTSMNSFIGTTVLPELLPLGKVGVFVDMPNSLGITQSDQENKNPYIYHYPIESILNWTIDSKNEKTYSRLLLKDNVFVLDEHTGLPKETEVRYRYLWVNDGKVNVQFYDKDSNPVNRFGELGVDIIILDIPTIPFVLFEISDSLLRDISDYQIALLNLASSDMAYSLKANFPFYVEQFDSRADNPYRRPVGQAIGEDDVVIVEGGERQDAIAAKNNEIKIGASTGRRIPKGLEMPTFIHPSSEPLLASMQKQAELKSDIRVLIKLAISNLAPKMASAESKGFDERGLEAGLSAIGLVLQQGERLVANYWEMYVGNKKPTIQYPTRYSLQSDKDIRDETKDLLEVTKVIPSITFRKEALFQAAEMSIGDKVSNETLKEIRNEINKAEVIVNPEEIQRDVEIGLLDLERASKAKGYPEGSVEDAAKDHAARVARIAESQAKARGVGELGGVENTSRSEKTDVDGEDVPSKKTRGVE